VVGDEKELNDIIKQHNTAVTYVAGCSGRLKTAEEAYSTAFGMVTQADCTRRGIQKSIQLLAYNEEESQKAEDAVAAHETAKNELKVISERSTDLLAAIDVDVDECQRITHLMQRSAEAEDWLKALDEVREFVHKDQFPKLAAQDWLVNMIGLVNDILDDFESPFRVEAGEDLTFIAIKPSGHKERADRLSGGEKVLLALAFRFAVNSLMAVDVGMMILDEPTAGVDKSNLDNLTEILKNVSVYTKDKGMQLIIITHDEALQRAFDQTIVISKVP
jgi:exonuclease SbcC